MYKTLNTSLGEHDDNLNCLTKQVGDLSDRFDNGEVHEANIHRLDAMEKKGKDFFERLEKFEKNGKEAAALAASIQGQQQQQAPGQVAGDVVQIQGVQKETPQGSVMKVYQKVTKPWLEGRFDIHSRSVQSPYVHALVAARHALLLSGSSVGKW